LQESKDMLKVVAKHAVKVYKVAAVAYAMNFDLDDEDDVEEANTVVCNVENDVRVDETIKNSLDEDTKNNAKAIKFMLYKIKHDVATVTKYMMERAYLDLDKSHDEFKVSRQTLETQAKKDGTPLEQAAHKCLEAWRNNGIAKKAWCGKNRIKVPWEVSLAAQNAWKAANEGRHQWRHQWV
jgi:hypothetical protein